MLRNIDPKKTSDSKAKKKQKGKTKDALSRFDYFESQESDVLLKFATCINGVKQAKLTGNKSNV